MTPPRASTADLIASLGATLARMVAIEMEALPAHWTEQERRDVAEKRVFGEDGR